MNGLQPRGRKFPSGLFLSLFLAVILAAGCTGSDQPTSRLASGSTIAMEPCYLSSPGLPVRLAARCGALEVFENRASRSGRQINLRVAVIPAIAKDPAPDPLFYLAGGPGQAATEAYPPSAGAFNRIGRDRDIVLVDQRGTGSSNPLECPGLEEGDNLAAYDDQAAEQALRGCLAQIPGDPSLYTTPIAMEDLDQVRQALGYEAINIYGVSYGSRAALNYLRQFPDRVRTVVLDGVWPTNLALSPRIASFAQSSFDLILQRCAADASCSRVYPNLRSEFDVLVDRLRQAPVPVNLPHPTTGVPAELEFTHARFASTIRLLSYAPETVALLPLLIHKAHAGDFQPLAAQTLILGQSLEDTISEAMAMSVTCAEDIPFSSVEEAENLGQGTYMGSSMARDIFQACSIWPKGTVPPGYNQPVSSQVPVLILSGEADPVTPPSNGDLATAALTNSLHVVLAGQGHGQVARGCVPRIMADFVESASLAGLDIACVQDVQPMPFFESNSGPKS